MIGLEYIFASHLILAADQVRCQLKTAPQVSVIAKGVERAIDNSKSISDLNIFKPMLSGTSPYGEGIETHIEGLTNGRIGMEASYQFGVETYPALNQACLYVAKIDVNITLDPKIFIAREFKPRTCQYNAVLGHEMKHFRTDRDLVNRYSNYIVQSLDATFKKIGYVQGPFPGENLAAQQKRLGDYVVAVVSQLSDRMEKERGILQGRVDTLEEYTRVAKMCPDRPKLPY